jgi:Ca-activated chloride channel family protein
MKPTITLAHTMVAVEHEHTVDVLLELAVPAEDRPRPPISLALVLDRSGSMSGGALETVATAARFLAGQLGAEDRVAVVSYDDTVSLDVPLGAPGPHVDAALAALRPGGMTNLSGGWLKAREQLAGVDGASRILLLTDGHANQGVTDPARLGQLVRTAAGERIGTSCFGVGDGFNEDLLGAMADAAGGEYHFLPQADAAAEAFATELGDLVALAAQNVSVEIRPADGVQWVGVLNDYPATPVDGGVQVALGDAYAGQTRSCVLRLGTPGLAALGPVTIAEVIVRYVSVGEAMQAHQLTLPVVVNVVDAADAAAQVPDAKVVEQVTLLEAARRVDEARQAADRGDYAASTELFAASVDLLDAMPPMAASAPEVAEHRARLEELRLSAEAGTWDALTSKRAHRESRSTKRRRT